MVPVVARRHRPDGEDPLCPTGGAAVGYGYGWAPIAAEGLVALSTIVNTSS